MEGMQLGAYRVGRELGSGGMGKVYAATGPDGSVVAIKVVHPHLLESPGFFKRFLREAQIGQSIHHANVVRTLDCDAVAVDGAQHNFLVMEHVEGQTLASLLRELGRVPEELCRHVGREVARGLAAIHAAGVVHRDLKPENVIVATRAARPHGDVAERPTSRDSGEGGAREGNVRGDVEYVVKIMDLGVAMLTEESIRLSQSGAFVGSAEYAAPEQFGGDVDHRCDLHALGVLLYELSTGVHPYRADDFRAVMRRVCDERPRRLGAIDPQLSPFFEEVVHTLLAKTAGERLPDAAAVLSVLEEGESGAWWHERARALQAATRRPLRRIRITRETAVCGRDEELAALRREFASAAAGEGRVVLVEGEAGIGKSRLVDELVARLQAEGEELDFLFGSYPPGGAATASGGFSSAFREHFGEAGSAGFLPDTPTLVPAFDAVLSGAPPPKDAPGLTADSLGTCFVQAIRSVAAERPAVVLIDDLHFAPKEALSLFTAVALSVTTHRVLLIGTMRPELPDEWVAHVTRLDHASRMPLPRLGPKDLFELLRGSFASADLAHQLAGQIGVKSDGNPFFAFEIIRGLREGQFITQREDGTWASTQVIDEIQIPSSVLDLVNARVATLHDEDRELLDVAACCGFEFDATLVGDALGRAHIPTLRGLALIEKRHRLVRCVGERFVFDHHQVQEALYGALPPQLARAYHSALAQALEQRSGAMQVEPDRLDGALCVELCTHCLDGDRPQAAWRYLFAAHAHLAQGYLHDAAVELLERFLAVPRLVEGRDRAQALLRLGGTLRYRAAHARMEECAREARRLAEDVGDDETLTWADVQTAWCLYMTGRLDEGTAVLTRALERADAMEHDVLRSVVSGVLGVIRQAAGDHESAREHLERSARVARAAGDAVREANSLVNLGVVLGTLGHYDEARRGFERAFELGRANGVTEIQVGAMTNQATQLHELGRFEEAAESQRVALQLMRQIGMRIGEVDTMGGLAYSLIALGHVDAARAQCERQIAVSRELDYVDGERRAVGNLGYALQIEGRLERAQEQYRRQLDLSRERSDPAGELQSIFNLGCVDLDAGELEDAAQRFRTCASMCEGRPASRRMLAYVLVRLAAVLDAAPTLRRGDEDVRDMLERALALAVEVSDASSECLAACALASLDEGDAAVAAEIVDRNRHLLHAEYGREALFLLWQATGERAHLAEAKRMLDHLLAHMAEEHHDSACSRRRINRGIVAAWRAEGEDASSGASESATRVGP